LPDTPNKIAVFIDFDNIEIGVRSTLGQSFDVGVVLEALKERGDVVSKTAYSDWKRAAGDYSRALTQHAIKMVQRNLTPGGDKNGADINLALDALEMAFTHGHINTYVIVGGDSDFISLLEKLKQYDKKVFVVGGRQFTSVIMQKNCHEFIAYENLVGGQARKAAAKGRPAAPIEQVVPLVRRALKLLSEREVSPQLGLLKSTLLQLDSTFSERSYGAGTFLDFAEKLASAGVITIQRSGHNLLVDLAKGERAAARGAVADEAEPDAESTAEEPRQPSGDPERFADGVREVQRLLQAAPTAPRFPMYLRNVKQFLRSIDPAFDERRYGFSGLVELLRACQKAGLLRLDRGRQGVLRVFQGPSLGLGQAPQPADDAAPAIVEAEMVVVDRPVDDAGDVEVVDVPAHVDADQPEPVPADTQAPTEKPKRRRRRSPGAGKKTAGGKPKASTRRSAKARDTASGAS